MSKRALPAALLACGAIALSGCTQETQNKFGRAVQNWTGTEGILEVYAGDKLVKRFKEIDEDNNWDRVPIAAYLLACPKPEATKYIKELEKIEPEAFQRAVG